MMDDDFDDEGPVADRVYLFRELATAFIGECAELFASDDANDRQRAQRALAMLAHASCVVADSDAEDEPDDVAERMRKGAF